MELLRTEEISINFDGIWALRDVGISVKPGEKLAIIGPNGAGKTTLLNVLNGLLRPTKGRIYFKNQDITHCPPWRRARRGMARSFQSDTLFEEMSVMDNLILAFHGMRTSRYNLLRPFDTYAPINIEVENLLREVNLWGKKREPVAFLSHGEKKKLEIATSFASMPDLLLLDEPNAGLTSEESSEIVEIIKKGDPGRAVLIVAHDMDLVFNLADEILVLHQGEVISRGLPDDIVGDPKIKEIYMGIEGE